MISSMILSMIFSMISSLHAKDSQDFSQDFTQDLVYDLVNDLFTRFKRFTRFFSRDIFHETFFTRFFTIQFNNLPTDRQTDSHAPMLEMLSHLKIKFQCSEIWPNTDLSSPGSLSTGQLAVGADNSVYLKFCSMELCRVNNGPTFHFFHVYSIYTYIV